MVNFFDKLQEPPFSPNFSNFMFESFHNVSFRALNGGSESAFMQNDKAPCFAQTDK